MIRLFSPGSWYAPCSHGDTQCFKRIVAARAEGHAELSTLVGLGGCEEEDKGLY